MVRIFGPARPTIENESFLTGNASCTPMVPHARHYHQSADGATLGHGPPTCDRFLGGRKGCRGFVRALPAGASIKPDADDPTRRGRPNSPAGLGTGKRGRILSGRQWIGLWDNRKWREGVLL